MLPEDEARKIEQLAILFPEVQAEIDHISETLLNFSGQSDHAPSPRVKEELMQKLQHLKEEDEKPQNPLHAIPSESQPTMEVVREEETVPVVPMHPKKKRSLLVAAVSAGLIFSLGLNGYLASQSRSRADEVAALSTRVGQLEQTGNERQQQLVAYQQTVQLFQDENYRKIRLTSVPGKPEAVAQVFWNPATREVFLQDVSLPQAPDGKQYQLWAMVDGKPVDAGMIREGRNLAQKMKEFDKADAFAITLEKRGGSPTPDLEQLYVMGKVS